MINVADLYNLLMENNISCFCGVPDSLLKDFCAYVTDNTDNKHHTITANEGNAIALAAGHYLATGNPALVYMQNSGIGNCVNPLLSLTDEEVYNIPLLMFIGWRGEPDKKDEPQHIKQGKVTDKLLDVMGIKYSILPDNFQEAKSLINNAIQYMKNTNCPYAFIIRKGTFEKYSLKNKKISNYELKREEAIETVIKNLKTTDIVVATTGHISREVYETRERLGQNHKQDFLTVGSMGHSSSIALGIALEKPDRNIYCFDGDGALLMHQGALGVNATKELTNFKHIVFNNEAHDSVGSQPTAMYKENVSKVALECGYNKSYSVQTKEELIKILPEFISDNCTSLLEIKVKCGAREDLGRPKEKPQENKKLFMENLNQIDFCYRGSIENLSKILKEEQAKNVLVFTGKKSFKNIKPMIEKELSGLNVCYYNNFSTNPKKDEVDIAITNIDKNFDIIVAVGGGRPILPDVLSFETDNSKKDFLEKETYYILEGLYSILINKFWISHPDFIRTAENKILQLQVAQELGFKIPLSLISNKKESQKCFVNRNQSIIKPIKSGLVSQNEKYMSLVYADEINSENIRANKSVFPAYLQEKIEKKYDLRITVVGEQVFTVAISKKYDNIIDWRKEDKDNLVYEKFDIPKNIENMCIALLKRFNLNFGAIDMALTQNGKFVFFEINPNGQWAWLDKQLHLNIAGEITNLLLKGGKNV